MRIKFLLNTCVLTLGLITSTYASKTIMTTNADTIKKATYIKLVSKPETKLNLAAFLQKGAQLVRQTEPNTPLWFALKENNNFAIFDVFFNEKGREEHFAGQVAHALKDNAPQLVQDGWEKGVLQNVNNFDIIAKNHFSTAQVLTAKEASYIVFKAKPGKSEEVEQFLKEGSKIIDKTEPNTYFWVALKMNEDTYAIFDAFPDQDAQETHFSGQVAAELQKNAERLIVGGWQEGILSNVHNFQIIALS